MLKKICKKLGIVLVCVAVVLSVVYVFATNNNYDRGLFFSREAATKNWGIKASGFFFEYSDENFYIQFDLNDNIKSVKKDGLFWVRNNYDSFPSGVGDDINMIRSITANDVVYIYGVTKHENAKEIKLLDGFLNSKDLEFTGKKIPGAGGLCFCAKIPMDTLVLSYELVFIDENDNIISDMLKNQNQELQTYLDNIQNNLSNNNYYRVVDKNTSLNEVKFSNHKVQEKFYLVRKEKDFFLQEVSQNIRVYFFNEYALISDKMEILQITPNNTENNIYTTTYKASYDENLNNFKNYVLENS